MTVIKLKMQRKLCNNITVSCISFIDVDIFTETKQNKNTKKKKISILLNLFEN